MNRFTATEIGALILAALLLFVGFWIIAFPKQTIIRHQAYDASDRPRDFVELVTPNQMRFYGSLCVLIGGGIAALVLYRGQNNRS
ncbi:MAG: hypothetical protein HY301_10055 [Verrucomicrobia bacterium]|nr:hypothetical protein [Verrucomicrobiota bacterium]